MIYKIAAIVAASILTILGMFAILCVWASAVAGAADRERAKYEYPDIYWE